MILKLIETQMNKNETVCDLSQISLNEEILEFIQDHLKNCPNIGYIKFDTTRINWEAINYKQQWVSTISKWLYPLSLMFTLIWNRINFKWITRVSKG